MEEFYELRSAWMRVLLRAGQLEAALLVLGEDPSWAAIPRMKAERVLGEMNAWDWDVDSREEAA